MVPSAIAIEVIARVINPSVLFPERWIFPVATGHLRDHEFASQNLIRTRWDPRQGGQTRRRPPRVRRTETERVFREWTRPFVEDLPATMALPKRECLFQLGSPFKALAHRSRVAHQGRDSSPPVFESSKSPLHGSCTLMRDHTLWAIAQFRI